MLRVLIIVIAAAASLLSACGGSAADTRQTSQTSQAADQTLPSDPPRQQAQDAAPAWRPVWIEPWDALHMGGWIRHSLLQCAGGAADTDQAPGSFFGAPGARWAAFGGVIGTLRAADGVLTIDSHQGGAGYALLSWPNWTHLRPVAVEAVIDLQPDSGAWLGLTLIADESDYRELALYEAGGRLKAGVWHPCVVQPDLAHVQPGPRRLRIEYTPPPADICWRHYVDGVLISQEHCDNPGAPLVSPPRVGIYIVNSARGPDGRKSGGYVRATVGPIVVEQIAQE